ncbi:class i glutamine amidotransferase [Fusarium sporotrichioides]|uniref:Class i glutamine amidotransferase n=1 Tax=Fusarium sporotrichioides TaxID=5514 RepID=A0A395S9E0_FUSSP|nr:class i glutamine amidotransferase [Fusarium sporotrichioides]
MLNADAPVPSVIEKRAPSYGHIFHQLLSQSATRVAPGLSVEAEYFDVYHGNYPDSLTHFDAIVISGSGASSYEDKDWIKQLDAYIAKVYVEQPHVKIFGSCFGHQIICQSLLREHGIYVEKDPRGMEMGVHPVQLEQGFLKALGSRSSITNSSTLRLQFIHGDHVKIPEGHSLPPKWLSMGQTKHCAFQGAYEPNHVLTYQGHFEFDTFINTETCKVFAKACGWEPQFIATSVEAMEKDDDSRTAADMVMRFFLEGRHAVPGIGGLMSPPLED